VLHLDESHCISLKIDPVALLNLLHGARKSEEIQLLVMQFRNWQKPPEICTKAYWHQCKEREDASCTRILNSQVCNSAPF
jgi:hypothetical protein